MENIKKVDEFLTKAGVCYFSTVDGDRPRLRPIGFHLLRGTHIYFVISNHKDMYTQLVRNPHAEIVACVDQVWLRYAGKAVFEEDDSEINAMLAAVPELKEKFSGDDREKLAVLHLTQAVCEFRRMTVITDRFFLNGEQEEEPDDIVRRLNMTHPDRLEELVAAGRFVVYYQPQYDLKMRALCGAEALVRFRDDDGQIVAPFRFIPALEEAHVIDRVDYYVFERICDAMKKRLDADGPKIIFASNFSKHTMADTHFVDRLTEIAQRYGVSPRLLAVEVTETAEADNRKLFLQTVRKLAERGFRISIDDFGVMGANMRLLTEINYEILKIDKSVIDSVHVRRESKILTSALIHACHQLGARVLAEGVESEEQAETLMDVKCDAVQGYLYGKPMPAERFEELLRTEPVVPADWLQ